RDRDLRIVLGADKFEPGRLALAAILAGDDPGTRECMVDGGDLVHQHVGIGFVERDALLDDGLVVLVERNAGGLVDARALDAARPGPAARGGRRPGGAWTRRGPVAPAGCAARGGRRRGPRGRRRGWAAARRGRGGGRVVVVGTL